MVIVVKIMHWQISEVVILKLLPLGTIRKSFFFSKWSFFGNILGKVFIGTTGKLFEKVEQNLPFVGYLLKESTLGTILL